MTVASFFSGVGGIDLAFENAGFKTIYANEINPSSCLTFEHNFNIKVDNRDIHSVQPDEIPQCNIYVGGFPCQAFSIAGLRQGFNDEKGRGNLFFELLRLFKANKPEVIFLENVKNLTTHDQGRTFQVIKESLEQLDYHLHWKVLNAAKYGIPQARERIYIVGFLSKKVAKQFKFPEETDCLPLSSLIDFKTPQEQRYYYGENVPFYSELKQNITKEQVIYQWRRKYVRENKSGVCPTLTANMGTGGHNVPLILTETKEIRKLTPRECFNLQGFPLEFKLPKLSNSKLYEQAGNSVCVPVVQKIAENIKQANDFINVSNFYN